MSEKADRFERLFIRADAIRERRASGYWLPIIEHLALRGYGIALLDLAAWRTEGGERKELGRFGNPASALGMMYRAYRAGERLAAYNLAISYFNVGDMGAYRYWLARAARSGDTDLRDEFGRFETRKPHALARRLRRLRPRRRDEF